MYRQKRCLHYNVAFCITSKWWFQLVSGELGGSVPSVQLRNYLDQLPQLGKKVCLLMGLSPSVSLDYEFPDYSQVSGTVI